MTILSLDESSQKLPKSILYNKYIIRQKGYLTYDTKCCQYLKTISTYAFSL